ncbi:hypothetical protein [Periweissella fabalis]|uniref:Uncharacterized protein n=1 Tax=Periweissella fabalis TaxID=1070421 RepID=A0A7X6N185_9LACO|nr:hypothetical protein [Periweissella fabalis]MCM0599128.1 hypothetical protein [Periweissella fabalis]NKZ23407.1 hypothetical protein [Periweissella fabalis]
MMIVPKGIEYWTKDGIADDAPDWAKIEYAEYLEQMDEKPDENGVVNQK